MAGTFGAVCNVRAGRRARANHEHPRHVYDAGRVEIQRLVECRRVLQRVRARARVLGLGL